MWIVTAINVAWLVLVAAVYAVPLPSRDLDWSVSVEYRDGRPAHVFLTSDDKWRLPVSLARVEPKYVEALVALEDKRFYSHAGVDPIAIVRAAWTDLTSLRRVSGGSTLSMQLARLLEPRKRTIPNKLVDMFRATQLDARMSKREILEQYLARAPFGRNLEGVESAALSYFGHSAQHLTALEIATLLAVPQGPVRYAPSKANLDRLRARRDAILDKLVAAGVFSGADATAALDEAKAVAPPSKLLAMPRQAPHAANWLRLRAKGDIEIRTTLDAGAQALVEKVVALHAPELRRKAIHNGAVVVVDHRTREIVALAGNLDFLDSKHGGQIAMFLRPRSPGSTLKPLLYSLAIDRGLALPEYLVADVPTEYGTYRPHNFDGDFAGLVTLRDALSRSLNIPFVELLGRLGVETFIGELERSGVSPSRMKPTRYGLSLVVGGVELTPLELAAIYTTLAEDGTSRPLRILASDPEGKDASIYGPAAAFLTREALSLRDRPDFPRRRELSGVPAEIHWKTGTSFGYRDAWAVGSGPAYTAVVWTGNVDNRASHELVGSEAAGPLLFDVLEGLADRTKKQPPRAPPADLTEVEVCAFSGHIAGEACTHRVKVRASLHSVPTEPCPYHKLLEVDRVTHKAVLPACRKEGRTYDLQSFVVLPSAISAWLVERHRTVPEAPTFAEGCTLDAGPLQMLTPSEGQVVTLIPGVATKNQVVPLTVSTRASTVTWFVDGALVATVASNEKAFWEPTVGTHEVVVADESGRKARRKLVVQMGASQIR
ncbi:MAG: penicillin-binding protein 1C [Kofleriaceae bacterium]|nr:penicillin-binding protein 1C [Kofleriaceae bacterium]